MFWKYRHTKRTSLRAETDSIKNAPNSWALKIVSISFSSLNRLGGAIISSTMFSH
jgi:hypothetical protein